jgi:hypothetical protein
MEVMARFTRRDDLAALDLIRREWGYMLDSPIGTGSTFWEGMSTLGTFVYGGSYESLAHAWSTAPTAALTTFVLGVSNSTVEKSRYVIAPQPGDLTEASGRVPWSHSRSISVAWQRDTHRFVLRISSPGVGGDVEIPVPSRPTATTVDGRSVNPRVMRGVVRLEHLGSGRHTVVVSY